MKCIIGILFLAIAATQLISTALPVRSGGMVFYQPSSDYYNAHRAFVMQYASQPIRPYRRQGQAAVVNAYASGKKIRTGTFVGQNEYDNQDASQLPEDQLVHSVAEAGRPEEDQEHEVQHDEEEEIEQQQPVASDVPAISHDVPADTPIKKVPTHSDEEDEDDEDAPIPAKKSSRGSSGVSYFPVSFGSTNGGAIAIANSYSTGGTASSRATAYGSPAKSKATSKKGRE
ncbi:hypothetical protein PVAND_008516 [Polypedilum vanderplanki]|uniref:Uncharacterized protein n=1 Tax=Polypedilum vanderplanki TaxID=319348 RepID=A0A9J6C9U9_POLVA|nr:hypothetical protein PVAND_008516 [Polypedilum vanderplanki]